MPTRPPARALIDSSVCIRIVGLLGMVVLVGLGGSWPSDSAAIITQGGFFRSVLNGMDNLLGALYSFPGGYLSDRLGTKRALLVFNLVSMVGFLAVILVPSWPVVLAAAALFLSWTAISLPATMSLVARVLPRNKRTMGVSVHSLVRRVPMALGPVVGGAFIAAWGVEQGVRQPSRRAGAMVLAPCSSNGSLRMTRPARTAVAERNPLRCGSS
jgi:MFS family permease